MCVLFVKSAKQIEMTAYEISRRKRRTSIHTWLREWTTTNETQNTMKWYGWRIVINASMMGQWGCVMWSKMGRSGWYGCFMWYDRSEHSQKIAGDGVHLRWFTMQQKLSWENVWYEGPLGYRLQLYWIQLFMQNKWWKYMTSQLIERVMYVGGATNCNCIFTLRNIL